MEFMIFLSHGTSTQSIAETFSAVEMEEEPNKHGLKIIWDSNTNFNKQVQVQLKSKSKSKSKIKSMK